MRTVAWLNKKYMTLHPATSEPFADDVRAELMPLCDQEAAEAVIYARGASFKEALTEVDRLRELADSEGTRAVEYLRRARKAEAVLHDLADACAEVNDLTPQAYRDKVLTLGARARVLLGPNTLLDVIDPQIRHALYMPVDGQDQLPGVEPATPVLRCNSFEKHTLATAHEGWTLAVDYGIDEEAPMLFGGCKVDKFSVDAKQGGSVVLSFRVGTSDIDADRLGKLGMHNGDEIAITLKAPEKKQEAIDGSVEAFQADHPDAGDLFAAGAAGVAEEGSDEAGTGADAGADGVADGGDGSDGPTTSDNADVTIGAEHFEEVHQAAENVRSTRTARGRAATQKALAEGAAS